MSEEPKFAADRMLGRLARWLRLMGADVTWQVDFGGHELLRTARAQGRVVLTRDSRLCTAGDVLFIESNFFREQLRQVLSAYPFDLRRRAFSRCSRCNTALHAVSRPMISHMVAPFVYASQDRFCWCPGCGRVYWNATHPERIRTEMERLAGVPGEGAEGDNAPTGG